MQLLVLDRARMNAYADGRLVLNRAIVTGRTGRTYKYWQDARWPIAIDDRILVGIRPRGARGAPADITAMRSRLNRIVQFHPRLDKLLLPVSLLQLAIAADAGDQTELLKIDNVKLLPTESGGSGMAHALAAEEARDKLAGAAERRMKHEKAIGLDALAADQRRLTVISLAIAEAVIDILNPTFSTEAKNHIWVQPEASGNIVPVPAVSVPPVAASDSEKRTHATQVAAILAATGPLQGLLAGLKPIWLDLRRSVLTVLPSLGILASTGAIVNVSRKLDEDWWKSMTKKTTGPWQDNMLFVAAATRSDVVLKE